MKLNNRKITVLGGDKRNLALANLLAKDGNHVTLYGFHKKENHSRLKVVKNLHQALETANTIVGPFPFSHQNNKVYTPLYDGDISVDELFEKMRHDQVLFAGKVTIDQMKLALNRGIKVIDFFQREELQILNAIPTSEGVIQIAMEKMETTLHESNVLILGFGRIGKTLAPLLNSLGANVHVGINKVDEHAWIQSYRLHPIILKNMNQYLPKMNLIINTIPSLILRSENLTSINRNTLIIDVASEPGGVDFKATEKIGINIVRALGLPGKVAPISSASYIKETIYHMMNELEV